MVLHMDIHFQDLQNRLQILPEEQLLRGDRRGDIAMLVLSQQEINQHSYTI